MKNLLIEWKHLDVDGETCNRCYDTGENINNEIKRLNRELGSKGIKVEFAEIKLNESRIAESNEILFNGVPIENILDIKISSNFCSSCTALTKKDVFCRTVVFDGVEYEDVPAKAIRLASMKVFGLEKENMHAKCSGCCGGGNCY